MPVVQHHRGVELPHLASTVIMMSRGGLVRGGGRDCGASCKRATPFKGAGTVAGVLVRDGNSRTNIDSK